MEDNCGAAVKGDHDMISRARRSHDKATFLNHFFDALRSIGDTVRTRFTQPHTQGNRQIGRFQVMRVITRMSAVLMIVAWAPPAFAQTDTAEHSVAIADLPQDLSPWGMFLHADTIVKTVMIGLAVASLVTWTVWVAKSIELYSARAAVRRGLRVLAGVGDARAGP